MLSPGSKRGDRRPALVTVAWWSGPIGTAMIVVAWHIVADPWADVSVGLAALGGAVLTAGYIHRNTTVVNTEAE